jgi:glycosyltransferase involved in cell wall biosynthesis
LLLAKKLEKMSTSHLVSVIIPSHNHGKYLRVAVESVLVQSYRNYEIIIVNDGSTDDTEQVVASIVSEYKNERIKYLDQKNTGVATARNNAIRQATGVYVLPLDADDKIHPNFLEVAIAEFNKNPHIGIVYTDYAFFGDLYQVVRTEEYELNKFITTKNLFTSSAVFKREAWEASGGYQQNMVWGFEDWEFWIRCGKNGFYGQRVPEVLFFYRVKLVDTNRNKSANAHSEWLFARMALNNPALYDQRRIDWAREKWANALSYILETSDNRGFQYIAHLDTAGILTEAEILRAHHNSGEEKRLYETWLESTQDPQRYAVYFNLGIIAELNGELLTARSAYQEAIKIHPSFELAKNRLAAIQNLKQP